MKKINLTPREQLLLVFLGISILITGFFVHLSMINQELIITLQEQQKLQLERLIELAPDEWWWQDSLDQVNQYLEDMRTTQ